MFRTQLFNFSFLLFYLLLPFSSLLFLPLILILASTPVLSLVPLSNIMQPTSRFIRPFLLFPSPFFMEKNRRLLTGKLEVQREMMKGGESWSSEDRVEIFPSFSLFLFSVKERAKKERLLMWMHGKGNRGWMSEWERWSRMRDEKRDSRPAKNGCVPEGIKFREKEVEELRATSFKSIRCVTWWDRRSSAHRPAQTWGMKSLLKSVNECCECLCTWTVTRERRGYWKEPLE